MLTGRLHSACMQFVLYIYLNQWCIVCARNVPGQVLSHPGKKSGKAGKLIACPIRNQSGLNDKSNDHELSNTVKSRFTAMPSVSQPVQHPGKAGDKAIKLIQQYTVQLGTNPD